MSNRSGALMVVEVDPMAKRWQLLLDTDLPGGVPLHWQPTPDQRFASVTNTGDNSLSILDLTKLRELRRIPCVGSALHGNVHQETGRLQ